MTGLAATAGHGGPIPGAPVSANDKFIEVTDPQAPADQRFYRIRPSLGVSQ